MKRKKNKESIHASSSGFAARKCENKVLSMQPKMPIGTKL
jgi:hypothetical protein